MTLGDLLGNATTETPIVVMIASAILAAAGWIGRRAFASQARQGRRLGQLERLFRSEQTRRRQVEQVLREQGIDLPYWPDDPAELHGITARRRAPEAAIYDWPGIPDGDGEPLTAAAEALRPPVPPFPADERQRLARHRR